MIKQLTPHRETLLNQDNPVYQKVDIVSILTEPTRARCFQFSRAGAVATKMIDAPDDVELIDAYVIAKATVGAGTLRINTARSEDVEIRHAVSGAGVRADVFVFYKFRSEPSWY